MYLAESTHHPAQSSATCKGFSVVIPAYNEEHGITPVLDHICDILAQSPWPYELIVVDDGSHDKTAAIIQQRSDVTLIAHPMNRGYGAALKTGIRHAHYDIVCITDADGTYPNERIFDLIDALEHTMYDMVVGARTGPHVAIPLVRRPAKWFVGKLANYVAECTIPDINSGFRVFRRDVVRRFFAILPDGFSFTTTITLCMLTSNYLVKYVPVNYHARIGSSKIRPFRDTLNFIKLILRIALYFAPLKIFLPLSGIIFVLAIAWGLFTHIVFGRLADVSAMVLFMSSIQVAALGLLAELINHRVPSAYNKEGKEDEHV
jgi:glycosyltransferase involved in cell wall biosynthesis